MFFSDSNDLAHVFDLWFLTANFHYIFRQLIISVKIFSWRKPNDSMIINKLSESCSFTKSPEFQYAKYWIRGNPIIGAPSLKTLDPPLNISTQSILVGKGYLSDLQAFKALEYCILVRTLGRWKIHVIFIIVKSIYYVIMWVPLKREWPRFYRVLWFE